MRVGLRCDAGRDTGAGHVTRCLALAEGLRDRGATVVLLSRIESVGWLAAEVDGYEREEGASTPDELLFQARRLDLDAVVLDSYHLDPGCSGTLRDGGLSTLAIVDGDTRGQDADLYLDQTIGAQDDPVDLPPGALRLAGLEHTLLRERITAARPARAPAPSSSPSRRLAVLCFVGGTDPAGAAPVLAGSLFATGIPVDVTLIAPDRPPAEVEPGPGQSLVVHESIVDLPAAVLRSDLVVCGAGMSTWEALCLGAPAALVCVAENQRRTYERTVARGLAVGLGEVAELHRTNGRLAAGVLRELLCEPTLRAGLSAAGYSAVDGRGRYRVADALLERLTPTPYRDRDFSVGGALGGGR